MEKDGSEGIFWNETRKQLVGALASASSEQGGEVILSRAMFNSRHLAVEGTELTCIAFEAPLTRKTHGQDSGLAKCDLIAFRRDTFDLVAVEVKCKASNSTNLDYAFLEALAYGYLLSHHVESSFADVLLQVKTACRHVSAQPVRKPPKGKNSCGVDYVVAGTGDYFAEQRELGAMDRLGPLIRDANAVSSLATKAKFAGFWRLAGEGKPLDLVHRNPFFPGGNGDKLILPTLRNRAVTVYKDYAALMA